MRLPASSVTAAQPANKSDPVFNLRKVLSGGMMRLGRIGLGSNPSMETNI